MHVSSSVIMFNKSKQYLFNNYIKPVGMGWFYRDAVMVINSFLEGWISLLHAEKSVLGVLKGTHDMTSSHGTFCTFSWVVKLSPSFWQHLDTVGERINIIMLIEIAGEGRCRKPQEVKLGGMEGTRNPRSPTDNIVLRGVSFSHTHDVQCSHILSSNSFNLV